MKDIILYTISGSILLLAIIIFIIGIVCIKKAKRKHQAAEEHVAEAKKIKSNIPTDNKIVNDLRIENERLKKANDALMQSNLQLSAGSGNDSNEYNSLREQVERLSLANDRLKESLAEKDEVIASLRNSSDGDALDRANDMYNRLSIEHQRLIVDYNAQLDMKKDLLKRNTDLVAEVSELKENIGTQYIYDRISYLAADSIKKAINDETKMLDELMGLKRNQLYAYAKLLNIKNYSKMKNKEIVAEVYKALRCK